jgi:hypothetical protein
MMSEFSISFHIRLDSIQDVEARLLNAGLNGLIFGPANGWMTFVPYGGANPFEYANIDWFAENLGKLIGCTVLGYCFGEDHGWMFSMARADQPLVKFACWWDPTAPTTIERDQFDASALEPYVSSDRLEPVLREFDQISAAREQPAYRFAQLLGLPAYKWLSPHLVQEDTQEFLAHGGREIGTKPPGA